MSEYKQVILDRLTKTNSLRNRINAKCCECIYDPVATGTWRKQIQDCTAYKCPLYPIRPTSNYSQEADNELDQEVSPAEVDQ